MRLLFDQIMFTFYGYWFTVLKTYQYGNICTTEFHGKEQFKKTKYTASVGMKTHSDYIWRMKFVNYCENQVVPLNRTTVIFFLKFWIARSFASIPFGFPFFIRFFYLSLFGFAEEFSPSQVELIICYFHELKGWNKY